MSDALESVRCSCNGGRVPCGHPKLDYGPCTDDGPTSSIPGGGNIAANSIDCPGTITCPSCKGTGYDEAAVVRLVERDNIIRERMTSYGINPDWSPAGLLRHMDNNSGATIAIERQLRKERDEQVTALTTERDELRKAAELLHAAHEQHRKASHGEGLWCDINCDWWVIRNIDGAAQGHNDGSVEYARQLLRSTVQRTNSHEEGTTT